MFSTAPTRTRNNGNQPNGSPDFVGDTMDSPSKTEHRGMAAYRVYRLGLLCLGVMCILQASLNITLRLFSNAAKPNANVTCEDDQLRTSLRRLTTEKEQLQTSCNQLQNQFDRLREELQRKTQSVQKTCPDGWTRRGTSMYYIGTGEKNWHQSRQDCRERGSDLVIINSREEQRFIQELNLQVWIGLSESQSTWTWVDGSSPSSEYWINGEPNEYRTGEDCAESKPNYEPPNTWNDERCSTVLNWVCEREAC
ncbi:CD209 antigen-like protein E isoform X1 [Colossoma macropomum]|uniref:CD209 antigen-like protein E isoform X1 n=1 Tax=Colossoma macropomum TaxID=42526 RepID=UPI001863BDB0|nr:CD209 antigen-like protein E isoform X1 [Colossoma macropomum]